MFCKSCGNEISEGTNFCPKCGASVQDDVKNIVKTKNPNESEKSRLAASLLAFFLGGLGVHRFYAGKIVSGIFQILLTFCFCIGYIWVVIDFIMIICGNFKDCDGKVISNWNVN